VTPLTRPDLSFEEIEAGIREVIGSGTLTCGPWVRKFERAVADRVGATYSIATTSATTALHLCLSAAGVGPGDEVLVSDYTFPATGNVVLQVGADPVLVDSHKDSFAIDTDDLIQKITHRTRAVIPVDPFGMPADMVRIEQIAMEHGLILIEDAACALGASISGRSCGTFGDCGCFSFHPRKSATSGEGGMITTSCDSLAERIRLLSNHGGRAAETGMVFEEPGYNYRMSELQAVVGFAQVGRLDQILCRRAAVAEMYDHALRAAGEVELLHLHSTGTKTYQSYVVRLAEGIDRDGIIRRMRGSGIETTIGTYALHGQPLYARYGYTPGDLPNSWDHFQRSLTLPLYGDMKNEDVTRITGTLLSFIGGRTPDCVEAVPPRTGSLTVQPRIP
jgi:perosamine synthetase